MKLSQRKLSRLCRQRQTLIEKAEGQKAKLDTTKRAIEIIGQKLADHLTSKPKRSRSENVKTTNYEFALAMTDQQNSVSYKSKLVEAIGDEKVARMIAEAGTSPKLTITVRER